MLTSGLQIERLAGGQLRVVAPSYTSMASIFFAIAAIPTLFCLYRAMRSRSAIPLLGVLLFGGPFFLAGLALMGGGSVTLDRAAGTATLVQPSVLSQTTSTVPLRDVQYAQIRTGRNSSRVVLILADGSAAAFSHSTDQGGQGQAVQAINDYLGVRSR